MTLMDFSRFDDDAESGSADPDGHLLPAAHAAIAAPESEVNETDTPDELSKAIEDLQKKPWRRSDKPALKMRSPLRKRSVEVDDVDEPAQAWSEPDDEDDEDDEHSEFSEPDFVKSARRQKRFGRAMRIFLIAGSLLMMLGLAFQIAYSFRDLIVAKWPETKPAMIQLCTLAQCKLSLPSQIDAVSIESSELQTVPSEQNIFILTALLRNDKNTPLAWPNIELALNDANGMPIVRRVFEPRDYLPSAADIDKGFAADSERPVKLRFELSELKASGYRVYLFYP